MRTLKSQQINKPLKKREKRPPVKKPMTPDVLDVNFLKQFLLNMLMDFTHLVTQYTLSDYAFDSKTLLNRLEHEGASFATKTLPILFSGLLGYLEEGTSIYPGFKMKRGANYPLFLNRLFAIVIKASGTCEIDHDEIPAIKCIYQIAVSFKKIKGPYRESILLEKFMQFVDVDAELDLLDLNIETDPILSNSIALCGEFIKSIDLDNAIAFIPRPGPGATATPRDKCDRFEPHTIYKQIDSVLPYEEWFYSHPWDVVDQSRTFLRLKKRAVRSPWSRFHFVQKKVDEPRGICIEENEMQFYQQAFRRGLQYYMKRDKLISKRIVFSNQAINAQLALTASADREMATLDESEASDRIARKLVELHFKSNSELCDAIMALSTKYIEPPFELTKILRQMDPLKYLPVCTNKYAPMGSALCFPIMSLIHFFLIRAIILQSNENGRVADSKKVYVYGDDIVVPSLYAPLIYEKLPRYGMKLNKNKSFYKSFFRESCGMHAYKGTEITPVFMKHTPEHTTADSLLSCLKVESDLYVRGYFFTSGFMKTRMLKSFKYLQLIDVEVPETSIIIGFKRPSPSNTPFINKRFKKRWNELLHCYEYRIPSLIKKSIEEPIKKQCSAYLRWFALHPKQDVKICPDVDSEVIVHSVEDTPTIGGFYLKWKWKPRSALYGVH